MPAVTPPALHPGDRVVVIAPASAPRDPAELERGLERLRDMDYAVEVHFAPEARRGYLAAPDALRLRTLNDALRRTDVHAILCVRGGYGALRLLPQVDYTAARRHPKLLVGYSDITALQWALYAKAGWKSLSGPVLTEWDQLDAPAIDCFRTLVEGGRPDTLCGPDETPLQPLRTGTAEGPLLGGNLAVLTRLIGTPYWPSLDGALLFLEDVGEAPYRIDRMLAHLALVGVLDALGGVVLGRFSTSTVNGPSLTLDEVFDDYFGDRSYPVATGLAYGHCMPRALLPIGTRAQLTVSEGKASLTLRESLTE